MGELVAGGAKELGGLNHMDSVGVEDDGRKSDIVCLQLDTHHHSLDSVYGHVISECSLLDLVHLVVKHGDVKAGSVHVHSNGESGDTFSAVACFIHAT